MCRAAQGKPSSHCQLAKPIFAGENRLELDLTGSARDVLEKWGSNARFFKFSSMQSDGRLRTPRNTRINGHSMTMLPYTAEHVAKSHEIMQQKHVHADFGVQPPSMEEVRSTPPSLCRPFLPSCAVPHTLPLMPH